jgi:RNA polymerase sigma factor (sigma-70 family)
MPSFQGTTEEAFAQWLVRIVENNIRDAGRYFGAGKRQARAPGAGEKHEECLIAQAGPTPSAEVAFSDELHQVGLALQRIAPDYRRVILMRLTLGSNHADLGRAMDRSQGTARVLLARARAALLIEMQKLQKARRHEG